MRKEAFYDCLSLYHIIDIDLGWFCNMRSFLIRNFLGLCKTSNRIRLDSSWDSLLLYDSSNPGRGLPYEIWDKAYNSWRSYLGKICKAIDVGELFIRITLKGNSMMETEVYGWLETDSKHSLIRAKERAGWNERHALRMMSLAKRRGISYMDCHRSADRRFLESKTNSEILALAYNGYCFIFERVTMNCITLFELPTTFGKKHSMSRYEMKMVM